MQTKKRKSKRVVCLLLTLLTIFPLIVAAGMFSASAAAEEYKVRSKSGGSIQYKGKNYASGATNSTQTFDLNSGFYLEYGGDEYWATCVRSGYKDPPVNTVYTTKKKIENGVVVDGLNQKDANGSHYIVSPVTGGKDSTAGYGRTIDAKFIFACYYYANKYKGTEFSGLDVEGYCELQEAIAIAYRYEWDTRLIKYGNTGTWNNATKTWTVNPVSSWKEDTTHFGGVTDGSGAHQAIVDAANAILKYAIEDKDGVRGSSGAQLNSDQTTFTYTDAKGGKFEMFILSGPNRADDSSRFYQDIVLFRAVEPDNPSYTIRAQKVDENGRMLPGATFALYKKTDGVYRLFDSQKAVAGLAKWEGLEAADYYVVETAAPPGYLIDSTKYYITEAELERDEIVTVVIPNNPFERSAVWTPNVAKLFEGGDLKKGQFTFELWSATQSGEKIALLQTATNDEYGAVEFKEIEYTEIGRYEYVVCERPGSDGSVHYDSSNLHFRIYVSSGESAFKITEQALNGRTFHNDKYGAIGVKKVDQNGKPLAGVVFELWRDPDCEWEYIASITTDDKGIATYGVKSNGDYSLVQGYTYYIKEKRVPLGYVMDPTIYSVTTVVGELVYVNNDIPIVNPSATGSWTPNVKKVMEGRKLEDGEFVFVLEDEEGNELQRVTNLADGSIPFEPIEYDASDINKKYTYTVREIAGNDRSVAYDEHVVTYTVTVSYVGSGLELTVEEQVDGDPTFKNKMNNGAIGVKKVDDRGEPIENVTFGVYLDSGLADYAGSMTTGTDGVAFFGVDGNGGYTLSDGVTYYLQEMNPPNGYVLDTTVYSVTVVAGQITYANNGEPIVNHPVTGSWTPRAEKVLEGVDIFPDYAVAFMFVVEENGVEIQRTSTLHLGDTIGGHTSGIVIFQPITYTLADVGTHVYTVREIGKVDGIYLDEHVITYTVDVSYTPNSSALTVTQVSVEGSTTFTNAFFTGSWTPGANKVMTGRELEDGEFTFVLEDEEGNELQRVTNLADGSIPFEPIEYDASDIDKEYTYTIREIAGDDPSVVYDDHTVTYTVTVSKSGTGKELIVEEAVEGSTTFTNKLKLQPGKIEILKTDPYGNALAGAEFLLEWSEDGEEWFPIFSATELEKGGCTSEGLADGKLITDADGRAVFDGLHPELMYRLTETKAPEGMQLLSGYAYEGTLDDHEDLTVSLRVVNQPKFNAPDTGDHGFRPLTVALPILLCGAALILFAGNKKRKKV